MSFNLKEEVIDGHLVTAETKKLWAVEMDLARKLLEVCEKHNLKIWAEAGTLLGAVRHNGFIPWDDDMDFCMMRNDYNKLLEIGPQEFKDPYFFQSIYTDNISGSMARLLNVNTTMLEKNYDGYKEKKWGVFIDILVLDVVPDDFKEFEREYKRVSFLRRMVDNYTLLNTAKLRGKTKILNIFNHIMMFICSVRRVQGIIVKILSTPNADENKGVSLIDFFALKKYDINKVKIRERQLYRETVLLPFYDMMIPAPIGFHEVLTSWYGEYLIPVKGTQLHNNVVINTERSYMDVLKDLRTQGKNT